MFDLFCANCINILKRTLKHEKSFQVAFKAYDTVITISNIIILINKNFHLISALDLFTFNEYLLCKSFTYHILILTLPEV